MTIERWYQKAQAYCDAWKKVFDEEPSVGNVVLGLSVAQHETRCGDIWPGEHNWGAVQKRRLSAEEKKALSEAGVSPAPVNVPRARDVLRDAGLAEDHGALHCDSSPTLPKPGWYFVYFWAFPNDAEGAVKFVKILAGQRAGCRAVLERTGTEQDLAAAMYSSKYYEGFHDPSTGDGRAANVSDYASALRRIRHEIFFALESWTPGASPPKDGGTPSTGIDLSTVLGIQRALNLYSPGIVIEDGIRGPLTEAAIKTFQRKHGLTPDGIVGPLTRAKFSIYTPKIL